MARIGLPFVFLLVLISNSGVANGAIIYFVGTSIGGDFTTARTDFRSEVGSGLLFEGFNDPFDSAASVSFPIGGTQEFTLSVVAGGGGVIDSTTSFGHEGTRAVGFGATPGETIHRFSFDDPITAFGIDILGFGGVATSINFKDDLGNSRLIAVGASTNQLLFLGVVNTDPFSEVTLTYDNPTSVSDSTGYDVLETRVAAIPEPSSVIVWSLLGLVGAGIHWRRRRRAAQLFSN